MLVIILPVQNSIVPGKILNCSLQILYCSLQILNCSFPLRSSLMISIGKKIYTLFWTVLQISIPLDPRWTQKNLSKMFIDGAMTFKSNDNNIRKDITRRIWDSHPLNKTKERSWPWRFANSGVKCVMSSFGVPNSFW